MYLSREWRKFLHAADLRTQLFPCRQAFGSSPPFARMHTSCTHSHTTQSLLPEQKKETYAHTAQHYFLMAKTTQIDNFSHSLSSLRLCQTDTRRASPLARISVGRIVCEQTFWGWQSRSKFSLAFLCNFYCHLLPRGNSLLNSGLASTHSSSTCSGAQLRAITFPLLICDSHFASRCAPRVGKWKSKETTPHRDFEKLNTTRDALSPRGGSCW